MKRNNGTTETATTIRDGRGALTVAQLASTLNLSPKTLYKKADAGTIPHFRLGSIIRFDRTAIADWLDDQTLAAVA